MIYVLSDIHGNEQRFNSVLKQINLQNEDILYILGDVIDRHPGGIRILRKIMSMPNAKMLLGNHEYMMLRALGHPYDPYDPTSELIREDMKDTVSKSVKVLIAKGNSFKNLNLVVAAFSKAVSHRCRKRIKNTCHPVNHSLSTLFEAFNPTVKSAVNPLRKR